MPQFGRNVVEFNNPSTQVKTATPSDHVLAYIGETNTPVYIPVSDLQNAILKEPINESVVAQGIDGNTTAKLDYGVNVITSASATNFAIRLPFPPIKGRTVTIINTSGVPLIVYPSVVGGSINGVVNGTATVPSNSNAYTFTCWENPLPGAWSWTPPATAQWDSGEIIRTAPMDSTGGFINHIHFVNNTMQTEGPVFNFSYWDGVSKPFIEFTPYNPPTITQGRALFKPSTMWNRITKVKVYTNLYKETVSGFRLPSEGLIMYYEPNTLNPVNNGGGITGDSILNTSTYTINRIAGAVPSGYNPAVASFSTWFAPNIGDPYTIYFECDARSLSSYPTNARPEIGNLFLGTQNVDFIGNVDVWWSQQINPVVLCTGFPIGQPMNYKFRMFIEYN